MGKLILKKKDLKGKTDARIKDKDTGAIKIIVTGVSENEEVSESDLKRHNIHLLDKVAITKEDGSDEEIGIVNDFYKED